MIFSILLFLVASAFFSGIETGIISIPLNRVKHLKNEGVKNADLLDMFRSNTDKLLGATLIGNNISVVSATVLASNLMLKLFSGQNKALSESISSVLMTIIILIMCEYTPKAWFSAKPAERCLRLIKPLYVFAIAIYPFSKMILWLTSWIVKGPEKHLAPSALFKSKEELKRLASEGELTGSLSSEETEMIHKVFELSSKEAKDIMIPCEEIVSIAKDASIHEFYEKAKESGFTRFPVYNKKTDDYIGIINVFYVLADKKPMQEKTISEFIRRPLYIPEYMAVDEIFPRLRLYKQPMCLVKDDNDKVIGLITTENILEEIVGEIEDD
ncbi:MAG: hemolysin family protein [Kiritimatiellae bacterium]|jgi:putative hemolysin|nr:hemolysin family protein [Kiritimatiellia bacterium]